MSITAKLSVGVYPHKRGETMLCAINVLFALGLSPQAWGNHMPPSARFPNLRSIPTSVGKPLSKFAESLEAGVYPHKRGETTRWFGPSAWGAGLSPQAWGNRMWARVCLMGHGSIPTSVGKPAFAAANAITSTTRVYPHKRGETRDAAGIQQTERGLSPQAWGNHQNRASSYHGSGSIPTSVGKPR